MKDKLVCACIDLGSNMCRMLIGKRNTKKPLGFVVLKSFSSLIYLGKDSTQIDEKGMHRAIKSLNKCKQILDQFPNIKVMCVATAIFRSATNAKEVLDEIKKECGLSFRVCMPDEEIMLSGLGSKDIFFYKNMFVMDMGGGSTEIGLFEKNNNEIKLLKWISLPHGLFYFGTSLGNKTILPPDAYKVLEKFGVETKELMKEKIPLLISRSGIMSILSKYIQKEKNISKNTINRILISKNDVEKAIEVIMSMSNQELFTTKLIPNLSHIKSIKGSLAFTKELMSILPTDSVILSNGGVKEGMMVRAFNEQGF